MRRFSPIDIASLQKTATQLGAANSCENLLKGIRAVVLLLARRVGRRRRGSLERLGTRRCKDSAYKEDRTTSFELRSEHDGDNMWNTKHKDDDEEDLGGASAFLCCTSTADSINIITQRYNSKHDCIFENNPGRMCVAPNVRNRTNEVAIHTRYHERCI